MRQEQFGDLIGKSKEENQRGRESFLDLQEEIEEVDGNAGADLLRCGVHGHSMDWQQPDATWPAKCAIGVGGESVMNKTTVAQQDKPVRHLRSAESISLLSGRVSSRPFVGPTLQMKPICPCGGGCPRCTSKTGSATAIAEQLRSPVVAPSTSGRGSHLLQAKLTIGASHDPLEQEADRVADQVMRMSEPPMPQHSAPAGKGGHSRKMWTGYFSRVKDRFKWSEVVFDRS